ncbi:hypothetical protein [Vibrio agarivorans]|uniref:Uncharacterized protein n=1 Tax=Vibrio agarivorans TaxID=153622 RepID=A0ABT7Y471_9VIBR|nr:hypothetical protein [Vibrio agarivorans]MDN2482844.1 hypothetical protein [Vibrio agarivorans]
MVRLTTVSLFLLMSAWVNSATIDEMGINVSRLTLNNESVKVKSSRSSVEDSSLSTYVKSVGVDVSNLTETQLSSLIGSYDQMPSAIFCEEHQEFEIQITGNDIWQRTKMMKLQQKIGPTLQVH